MSELKRRARYTPQHKLGAVKRVKACHVAAVTAKILGIPKQSLENWVRLGLQRSAQGSRGKPVSREQMELTRLHAQNARLRMERDILGKATLTGKAMDDPE